MPNLPRQVTEMVGYCVMSLKILLSLHKIPLGFIAVAGFAVLPVVRPVSAESLWKHIDDPLSADRVTGIGRIDDSNFPFVWHYPSQRYLYISGAHSSLDGMFAYDYAENSWFWTHNAAEGWHFRYADTEWSQWELPAAEGGLELLTDPFLQLPEEESVRVVWFTEFEGSLHYVETGEAFAYVHPATSRRLTRMAEDNRSWIGTQRQDGSLFPQRTDREIWRHEAIVAGLTPGERTPYRIVSRNGTGQSARSGPFSLAPLPLPGQPLKILLTADHQVRAGLTPNLQKVEETVGRLDAVFLAGDMPNFPDRASEWFDDSRGLSIFASLQGRGQVFAPRARYRGGALIQHAPLFPVIGNHEVMGRFDPDVAINPQFGYPQPRWFAEERYEADKETINPEGDPAVREAWIRDNSFNTISYQEIFTLPDDGPDGSKYYSIQFGDVYLIGLFITRIWRTPNLGPNELGRYREREADFNNRNNWGFGDFLFWDFSEGSSQYEWFAEQLQSEAFRNAPLRIVISHETGRGAGLNVMPPLANPEQFITHDEHGNITFIGYDYPREADIFRRDLHPLIEAAEVDLYFYGHSHLWGRLITEGGVNYLESSLVGNTFGSFLQDYRERNTIPADFSLGFDAENYRTVGDPYGAEMIFPSIEIVQTNPNDDSPLPTVDRSGLTVFSVLDTGTMTVSSYYYDMFRPGSDAVKFDEFSVLNQGPVEQRLSPWIAR